MRFDALPIWAQTAIVSAPFFGSDGEGEGEAAGATITDAPDEKPDADKPVNINPDDALKAIRERDQAKTELAALQQEKQERDDADAAAKAATLSKEENLTNENSQLQEAVNKLTLVNTENLLELSVLKNAKFQWQDPTLVVKLIDRADIKIDAKSGKVEGVEDALKTLAKNSPFLLKSESENSGDNGGQSGQAIPGQPSGGKPNSSKDSSAKANKRKAMVDRFGPVLVP